MTKGIKLGSMAPIGHTGKEWILVSQNPGTYEVRGLIRRMMAYHYLDDHKMVGCIDE